MLNEKIAFSETDVLNLVPLLLALGNMVLSCNLARSLPVGPKSDE